MKLTKKVLAGVMASVLLLGSAVGVSAAGSRAKNVTLAGDSAGKFAVAANIESTAEFTKLKEEAPETAAVITDVNSGTKSMAEVVAVIEDQLKAAGLDETAVKAVVTALEGADFVTGFVDISATDAAEKNANGKYEVTMSVPSLTDKTTGVKVLHYSTERKVWEVVDAKSVDLSAKTITFELEDLSPVAVVAKEGTASSTTATSGTKSAPTGTSPKTEGSSVWMMWAAAAVLLLGAGTYSVSRKKSSR